MSNIFDGFLSEEKIELPSGGTFTPSGLIAPWICRIVYRVGWTDFDLRTQAADLGIIHTAESQTGKFRYYFTNLDQANAAKTLCGYEYAPETVWHLEAETAKVLNFFDEDTRGKFGATIAYDASIKTPASGKYRHEFHLITLPHTVQAVALMLGFLTEPVYDTNELLAQNFSPDLDWQIEYTGDPADRSPESMIESVFGKRRAELWKALGEENPLAYVTTGSSKYVTTSPKLAQCLRVIESPWLKPLFAEVIAYPDPRVESVDKNDNRMRVATISRFFKDEASAKAAADEQLADRKGAAEAKGTGAAPASSNGETPKIPVMWEGISETDLIDAIKSELKTKEGTLPEHAKALSMSLPELNAWKTYLKL